MEERLFKCSSGSEWSFCAGACSNEYKGDDWCSCYSSDTVTLALVLDGVSGSSVESGEGEECFARGAAAARAVADYYVDTVVPILEESAAGEPRLALLVMAESLSPGRVSVSLRGGLLRWIVRSVRSRLLALIGRSGKCLVGGQAVMSGVAALRGGGVAFLQAGDTDLVSTICRVPVNSLTVEEAAWGVYRAVETMFRPLPPHTLDGDPSHFTSISAGLSGAGVEASVVVEPSIALAPWRSLQKYGADGWRTLLLSVLYSDGFRADLPLRHGSQELAAVAGSIGSALAGAGSNSALEVFERFLSLHNTMSDGVPLSVAELVVAGACAALNAGASAGAIEAIVEELLARQPLVAGRDDRTLLVHGILLG